jgi:putative SOS response-associated peptidase YedK
MCGRYALTTPPDVLAKLFQITAGTALTGLVPRYNLAPSQPAPVIRCARDSAERHLDMLRWGLVPFWADDPQVGYRMINARCESVAEKPAYREAFASRRCLVPADGFFEWRTEGGRKQPYFIHHADGELLAFAGLWERWRRGEERLESFTIVTAPANGRVRELHDRMPAIIPPEKFGQWLDPEVQDAGTLRTLLGPAPDELLSMHAVSRRVNRPENDDATLLEEVVPETSDPTPQSGEQMGLFGE